MSTQRHRNERNDVPPWVNDTLGDVYADGGEHVYIIRDTSFDDAIVASDTSYRLNKMI